MNFWCSFLFLVHILLYSISISELYMSCKACITDSNSNSNWTFIAFNLPIQEDSKSQQNQKNSQPNFSIQRQKNGHHGECQGMIRG